MRRRRVERCVLRANVALEAGFPDDARLALDEARRLDPYQPQLDEVAARIEAASPTLPAIPPPSRGGRLLMPVAATLLLTVVSSILAITGRFAPTVTSTTVAPEPLRAVPAATVGVREQFVTPDIITAEPEPPPAAPREPAVTPREPAVTPREPGVTPREPAVTPRETPPPARADPAPQAALPLAEPPVPQRAAAAAPPPPAVVDVPSRASAEPAPIGPLEPLGRATPATPSREPVAEPEVDPAIENVSSIRAVLSRYEAAYSRLDAEAARAVWPSVDQRTLARAFNNLESQRISLAACDVAVDGASARAECQGSASWVPKVGGGGRTAARRWTFDLRQASGGWQIVRAEAR